MKNHFHVLLASNANLDAFPQNTLSEFTNLFPNFEQPEELFVRIKGISISKRLKSYAQHPGFVKVEVNGLQSNVLEKEPQRTLVRFNYSRDPKGRGDYQVVEFEHTPYLKLRTVPITQLSVRICDNLGRILKLEDGLPTLVHLELTNMNSDQQFSLTCISHNQREREVYLQNKLNNFHVRLPQEMTLNNWEMAVAGVGIPPQKKPEETLTLRIRCVQVKAMDEDPNSQTEDIQQSFLDRKELYEEILPYLLTEGMTKNDVIEEIMKPGVNYDRRKRELRYDNDGDARVLAYRNSLYTAFLAQNDEDDDGGGGDIETNLIDMNDDEGDDVPPTESQETEESEDAEETEEEDDLPYEIEDDFDETFTYSLDDFTSTLQLGVKIATDIKGKRFLSRRLTFYPYDVGRWGFVNYPARGYRATFRLDFNQAFLKFLGEEERKPTKFIFPWGGLGFYKQASLWRIKKSNMAMLYCDVVEPSIVSDQKLQLLHIVPFDLSQQHKYYEPKHLIYRPVVSRTFSDIGFQLTNPDGSPYEITDQFGEKDAEKYGGLTIVLLFRPIRRNK